MLHCDGYRWLGLIFALGVVIVVVCRGYGVIVVDVVCEVSYFVFHYWVLCVAGSVGSVCYLQVLAPMRFFSFSSLRPNKVFFVGDTRIIPGRDARAPGETVGRPVVVSWFEEIDNDANGIIVQRVSDRAPQMDLMLCSPAELVRAAGCYPAPGAATARDAEVELESKFMNFDLTIFTHRRLDSDDLEDPFTFHLSEPTDAEELMWSKTPYEDHTKMGLARRLEASGVAPTETAPHHLTHM